MMNTIKNTISSTISKGDRHGHGSRSIWRRSAFRCSRTARCKPTKTRSPTRSRTISGTVASLFNSTNGVAAQLNTSLTSFLQTGGIIDTRTTALNDDLTSIADQQTQLTAYTQQLTTTYNDAVHRAQHADVEHGDASRTI